MKRSELRQLIREEYRKVVSEDDYMNKKDAKNDAERISSMLSDFFIQQLEDEFVDLESHVSVSSQFMSKLHQDILKQINIRKINDMVEKAVNKEYGV